MGVDYRLNVDERDSMSSQGATLLCAFGRWKRSLLHLEIFIMKLEFLLNGSEYGE